MVKKAIKKKKQNKPMRPSEYLSLIALHILCAEKTYLQRPLQNCLKQYISPVQLKKKKANGIK